MYIFQRADGEPPCTETVIDENLVKEICFEVNNGDGECESQDNTIIQLPPLEKQIEVIALTKLVAEQHTLQDPEGFKCLSRLQRQLKSEVVTSRKQTSVNSFNKQ